MKKMIFLLLLLAKLFVASASPALYKIKVTPYVDQQSGRTVYYVCQVAPDPTLSTSILTTLAFTDGDLVTWIFPDGQYLKKAIGVDADGAVKKGTDTLQWRPYANAVTGPDSIVAYVAKKGGQTNPGRGAAKFNGYLNSTPESFYFPTGQIWQLNKSWEFSPGNENFLIFSYKPPAGSNCPQGGNIRVAFNLGTQQQISLAEQFGFNNEIITPSASAFNISIPGNLNNAVTSHIFFKVKSNTQIGDFINIHVSGSLCGKPGIDTNFGYETKGVPHDPNQKKANVRTVPNNTPSRVVYTIQFQNDGKAPVDVVNVRDVLPPEVDWSTHKNLFAKNNKFPNPTSVIKAKPEERFIGFEGLNLPGLSQRNPSYGYDYSTHWFSFEVYTHSKVNTIIDNKAEITFVGSPDPPLETNIARVTPVPQCTLDNLVTNGHFRLGNNGSFQSGWPTPKCNSCTAASYCIGNQFKSKCSAWPANSFDHTFGNANGSFLIFDGDPFNPATVWTSTVCVTQGQVYTFSFWAKSLYAQAFPLGMLIDGILVNTVKVAQPTPVWTEYRISWRAPVTKCLPIAIEQLTKGTKRDFGVDDIVFGYCK